MHTTNITSSHKSPEMQGQYSPITEALRAFTLVDLEYAAVVSCNIANIFYRLAISAGVSLLSSKSFVKLSTPRKNC